MKNKGMHSAPKMAIGGSSGKEYSGQVAKQKEFHSASRSQEHKGDGRSAPGDAKWEKHVAAGDKSPKAYDSGNGGMVRESKEIGATGSERANPIKQKFGDHGPE